MNFNYFRCVVFKLQDAPRTRQNPPRTHQNPLNPTNERPTQASETANPATFSGRLSAQIPQKHKMFSYSYNGNPETHGSMSYVFFIDQIPKSLTFERAQRPTTTTTTTTTNKKATLNLFSFPNKDRKLFSSTHPKHFSCSHSHSYTCTPLAEHFPFGRND